VKRFCAHAAQIREGRVGLEYEDGVPKVISLREEQKQLGDKDAYLRSKQEVIRFTKEMWQNMVDKLQITKGIIQHRRYNQDEAIWGPSQPQASQVPASQVRSFSLCQNETLNKIARRSKSANVSAPETRESRRIEQKQEGSRY
jgi:hypothetical protein